MPKASDPDEMYEKGLITADAWESSFPAPVLHPLTC
jgi:hypothetical protein